MSWIKVWEKHRYTFFATNEPHRDRKTKERNAGCQRSVLFADKHCLSLHTILSSLFTIPYPLAPSPYSTDFKACTMSIFFTRKYMKKFTRAAKTKLRRTESR